MQHLVKSTKCSKDSPILLILDNHESHITLPTIDYARDNGVVMLTLPPHCSHKLQPLDRTVYGPFKTFYNQACNAFMVNNPGQPITIHDIGALVGKAYPLAFTQRNIVAGFSCTGICPFNPNTFTDEDFLSSYVTDRPDPSLASEPECPQPPILLNNNAVDSPGPSTIVPHHTPTLQLAADDIAPSSSLVPDSNDTMSSPLPTPASHDLQASTSFTVSPKSEKRNCSKFISTRSSTC